MAQVAGFSVTIGDYRCFRFQVLGDLHKESIDVLPGQAAGSLMWPLA